MPRGQSAAASLGVPDMQTWQFQYDMARQIAAERQHEARADRLAREARPVEEGGTGALDGSFRGLRSVRRISVGLGGLTVTLVLARRMATAPGASPGSAHRRQRS
jgi:hypothetical protein